MLSDPTEYDGGTLELRTDRAHPIPLGRGEVIIFPSATRHAVSPVIRGERRTVVGSFRSSPPVTSITTGAGIEPMAEPRPRSLGRPRPPQS